MHSTIIYALFHIGLCSAAYYTPAQVCPTKVALVQRDMEMTVSQIHVVEETPYTNVDIHVNTMITSQVVVATKVVLATVKRTLEPVTHTKVSIYISRIPVTITRVKSVTKKIINTDLDIATITATNYNTEYVTKNYWHTVHIETVLTETWTSTHTRTITERTATAYLVTESPVITTEITTRIPHTRAVYVTVALSPAHEITHTFTTTLTSSVCPQRYYH